MRHPVDVKPPTVSPHASNQEPPADRTGTYDETCHETPCDATRCETQKFPNLEGGFEGHSLVSIYNFTFSVLQNAKYTLFKF